MISKSIVAWGSLALISSGAVASCDMAINNGQDSETRDGNFKSLLVSADEAYLIDVAAYRVKMKQRIVINDLVILLLKSRSNQAVKHNPYYEFELRELEARNENLDKIIDAYEGGRDTNWINFKEEFNQEMELLSRALDAHRLKNTIKQ